MTGANGIGIDGCPMGWVGATRDGVVVEITLAALLGRTSIDPATDIVAIDMPIGLAARGRRRCDELARERLKPYRHASVFWVPTRSAIGAETQDEASRINRQNDAPGVSAQAFNLFSKIREIDALLCDQSRWRRAVHEVHPELAFAAMNSSAGTAAALAYPKRSGLGAYQRLSQVFERFDRTHFEKIRAAHAYSALADDDIADAYACLFSAERIAAGRHVVLPAPPPLDQRGLPMRICF